MRILLSNDDGILAPGILALHRALQGLGELHVVAPASHQSGASRGITVYDPLRVREVRVSDGFTGLAVEGRPADCVKLALQTLLGFRPDLVVSGINEGANVGCNVLYSGTVAAASEGALAGIPAVAVSLAWEQRMDFDAAGRLAREVIALLLERGLPPGRVANVNLPRQSEGPHRGLVVAPMSVVGAVDAYDRRLDPAGGAYYWATGGKHRDDGHEAQSDVTRLRQGHVVLTPLQFDMTDHDRLADWSAGPWPLAMA